MAENRVFVETGLVDRWIEAGGAELVGGLLRARGTGASYALEEAVFVSAEVTQSGDPANLVGRVRPVAELVLLGAEILERSLVLGEAAYDVVPGFLAAPAGREGGRIPTSALVSALSALSEPPPPGQSDEDLLARYLIQKLE